MIVILPESDANTALSYLHTQRYGEGAQLIGKVSAMPAGQVCLRTPLGTTRARDAGRRDAAPHLLIFGPLFSLVLTGGSALRTPARTR